MLRQIHQQILDARLQLRRLLIGPQTLAFLPALALAAFWFGGEELLIGVTLGIPMLFALLGGYDRPAPQPVRACDGVTGLPMRDGLEDALSSSMRGSLSARRATACFMVSIDEYDVLVERFGGTAGDHILRRTADRLRNVLREHDLACRTGSASFGIALAPVAHVDIEAAIQMASRLQAASEEPIVLDNTVIYVSVSIGFCLGSRTPEASGDGLIQATALALSEAVRNAPSAIRSYSDEMRRTEKSRHIFADEAAAALENGDIRPHYQPQICTDTGKVTGFEALARWIHPERGTIPPADFLPILENAGKLARLGEVMLGRSLAALRAWEEAGLDIACVGVNFSSDELRNPKLIDKVKWELDRYDLAPNRLAVEVLETVVAATPEDVVARNVNGLAKLGCRVDLDDFGTGHASISSIRRFAIGRIKIDRSFVMKVDRDPEQQRMVAAILTMAERLDLETLAEGVETAGEHAMLAQLGCDHVQGFGIGHPMPFEATEAWVRNHMASLEAPPSITRRNG
ncbi:putative bifunctional diguanylate cyclase/phosphodiesterase [Pseudooceanicola sp.]|uniref:putative bifunctional diguanylate cyclase/phosphodiesterase n=1 Tax=Pseudooceanicola sp. TaxID=1914328 RepID=UPI000C09C045|nr:diguanylate cyclase [Pseudooceanicola sp.]